MIVTDSNWKKPINANEEFVLTQYRFFVCSNERKNKMVNFNINGNHFLLKAGKYSDGHLCIMFDHNGNTDSLSTNFSDKDCKRSLMCSRGLKENEILICMTPSYEHPNVRPLGLCLSEMGLLFDQFDFIRTYNEYYLHTVTKDFLSKLKADEIFEIEYEEM